MLHVLLLIAFIKDPLKCLRNSTTYLVANLAVSNLTVSLCSPHSMGTKWLQSWVNIIWQMAVCMSLITIFSIASDRYLMVAYPFQHRSLMGGKKMICWYRWSGFYHPLPLKSFLIFSSAASNILFVHSINSYISIILMLGTGLLYKAASLSLRKQAQKLAVHASEESGSDRTQEIRRLKEKRFLTAIRSVGWIEVIGVVPCLVLYEFVKPAEQKLMFTDQRPPHLPCTSRRIPCWCYFIVPLVYKLRLPKYR